MSTLRVDNIKSRTGTTVTIPDSQSLAVTGGLTVSGVIFTTLVQHSVFKVTNINTGVRGDVLYYDANGAIAKLNIGPAGAVLQSDGTDVTWGAIGGATNVYYVAANGTDAAGRGGSIDTAFRTVKYACSNIGTPTLLLLQLFLLKQVHTKKFNFQSLFLHLQQLLVITFVLQLLNQELD